MKVNISEIREESGDKFQLALEDDLLIPVGNDEEICSVQGNIEILNAGDHLRVSGSVSTDIKLKCHRCLEDFSLRINADVSDTFINLSELTPKRFSELEQTCESYRLYEGSEVDLSDSLKEGIVLSIPIKILCSENCRGLCSNCGQNLNEKACDCKTDDIDPRLEKLKDLFDS